MVLCDTTLCIMENTFSLTGDLILQEVLVKSDFNEKTFVDFEKEIKNLDERFCLFQKGSKKIPDILTFIKFPTDSFPKNDTENFISAIPQKEVDLMREKLKVIRNDDPSLLKSKTSEELKDFDGLQNLLNSAQNLLQDNRLLQAKMIKLGCDAYSKEIITLKFQAEKLSSFHASSELLSKLVHTYKFVQNSDQKNSEEYKKTIKNLATDIGEYYNNQDGEVDDEYIQTILNMETAKKVLDNVKTKNLTLYEKINPKLEKYTSSDKNIVAVPEKIPVETYYPILNSIIEQTQKYLPEEMNNFKGSEEEVTPEEMQKYAQQIIDNIYKDEEYFDIPDEKKWKAVLDDRFGYVCEIKKKELKVPSRNYTKSKFLGSMYHEVFIHIFRQINGSKIDSLDNLPDYSEFEEGLASILQQYMEGKKEITFGQIPIRQVSIALASAGLSYQEVSQLLEINK